MTIFPTILICFVALCMSAPAPIVAFAYAPVQVVPMSAPTTTNTSKTPCYAFDALNLPIAWRFCPSYPRVCSRRSRAVGCLIFRSAQSADAFTHDPVGNLLSASNATATLSFGYDLMDRLVTATTALSNATYNVTYHRDAGGLVTNLVYATGKTLTRTYDPDGCLASVSDWIGHTWTFAWDGAGKPTGGTSPGGIVATNHYDAAGRLASWSVGTLAGRTITRDLAGLKTRDDITAGPHPAPSFVRYAENTFDAADRLVSASVRYGSHTNAAVSETYQYDGNGALTNLVSGSNAVFSAAYDPLGQLGSLSQPSTLNPQTFFYDALGNRIISGDRLWIPDHADPLKRPLIEADAATGEPIRYYLWGPGRLLGFIDAASGVLTVAHCDEYGSVVALTDASGNTLHTACYGPNGQDWGTTGTNPTPYAWLGGHGVQKVAISDHLGPLYLTRYRLYSASLNRFLSSDPLGLAGGLNLYAYAEGDPLSYIDPLGLCGESGNYWETGSYLGDMGQFYAGYGDAIAGTIGGIYNMVRHPIQTAQGLAGAIAHPVQTAKAVANSVADTWSSGNRGQGQIVGNALIAAATIAAPYAKAGGTAKAAAAAKSPGVKYIGKLDDLKGFPRSQTLLDDLPDLGSSKANYHQNSSVLRKALRDGYEIRDASAYRPNPSPDPTLLRPERTVGQSFLGAERNILDNKGFMLNSSGVYVPK